MNIPQSTVSLNGVQYPSMSHCTNFINSTGLRRPLSWAHFYQHHFAYFVLNLLCEQVNPF